MPMRPNHAKKITYKHASEYFVRSVTKLGRGVIRCIRSTIRKT